MELQTIGSKVLRDKAKRVANIDDSFRCFCYNMAKVMRNNRGIGISAPQVGISKRVIVVDNNGKDWFLVNPEIIWSSEKITTFEEGCLSVPGKFDNIKRPESIKVKYRTLKGKPSIELVDGILARIIQHEIDHLDGILFVDYLK